MGIKSSVLSVIIISSLFSCSTKPYNNHLYSGTTLFYTKFYTGSNSVHPAVLKVFQDNAIYPKKIDIINNVYTSDYIHQSNFGAKLRYTVYIEFKYNTIKVQLKNIQQYSIKKGQWINEDRLSFFDVEKLPTKLAESIYNIVNNQQRYQQVKNEIYNNFLFHYLVIKHLPKNHSKAWITQQMMPHTYSLNVTLSHFEQNKSGKMPNMRYIAEFTNTGKSNNNDNFVIKYYTNNKQFASIYKKSAIIIQGKLVNSNKTADMLIKSSHILLVDN